MAATPPPAAPASISGQVLLYQQPEPLDSERHAGLGMRRTERPFSFAAQQHFIPLQVGEFGPAAVSYPIIFAGEKRAPLAVMGLAPGENLFISADGAYRPGAYIPNFLRRYPFVGARDDEAQRVVVCIDRASDLWVEGGGDIKLFEAGQPTDFTKSCIEFCGQFDADQARTDAFVQLLTDLDLFELRKASFTPRNLDGTAGEVQTVAEFHAVTDERVRALPEKKLVELRDNGALSQIYGHLTSLFGWDRIIGDSLSRRAGAPVAGQA